MESYIGVVFSAKFIVVDACVVSMGTGYIGESL